ncbi:hypothetical protein ONZ45_g9405 [Pleurotus djamor]|nr:hypothetical protein ONZ45_g9405 [Pleurotus djamor]
MPPSRTLSLVTDHWGILVDEIRVGNHSVLLNSTVPSTPQGKAIAVLDSGFSLPPILPHIVSEIYGNIPGAIRTSEIPGYDLEGQWILPCDHPAELSLMIGGIEFPINPLDLVFATTLTLPGADFDDVADMILGDAFLKNAYVAHYYEPYNVSGDAAEKPFMQLLPTTDIEQARREFPSVRAAQIARTNATVLSPAELVAKLLDISDNTTSSFSHEEPDTDTDAPPVRGVLATQDDNANSTLSDFVSKFGPAIVGLLAGNVFLLIVVCSIAVFMCVTRSGKPPSTRTLPTTYQPLHLGGATEKQQLEPVFAGRYDA